MAPQDSRQPEAEEKHRVLIWFYNRCILIIRIHPVRGTTNHIKSPDPQKPDMEKARVRPTYILALTSSLPNSINNEVCRHPGFLFPSRRGIERIEGSMLLDGKTSSERIEYIIDSIFVFLGRTLITLRATK